MSFRKIEARFEVINIIAFYANILVIYENIPRIRAQTATLRKFQQLNS